MNFWRGGAWPKKNRFDFCGDHPDHFVDPGLFFRILLLLADMA